MSLEIARRVKALEAEVAALKKLAAPVVMSQKVDLDELLDSRPGAIVRVNGTLENRVRDLENKYRMLNARLNKKNNKDADDGRGTSNST